MAEVLTEKRREILNFIICSSVIMATPRRSVRSVAPLAWHPRQRSTTTSTGSSRGASS